MSLSDHEKSFGDKGQKNCVRLTIIDIDVSIKFAFTPVAGIPWKMTWTYTIEDSVSTSLTYLQKCSKKLNAGCMFWADPTH